MIPLAVHEAGHALAASYFGCPVFYLALSSDGRGHTRALDPLSSGRSRSRGEIVAIVATAGAAAEEAFAGVARHRSSEDQVLLFRGLLDCVTTAEYRRAIAVAKYRAGALLASPPARRFVIQMSQRLIRDRHIDGDACRIMFAGAFGRPSPRLEEWLRNWPPDLSHLARGWLPSTRALYPGWHKNPAFMVRKAA